MAEKVDRRRREILNQLDVEGVAYLQDMANLFQVTKETVRKDFDYLAQTYGFERVHGGIKKSREEVYQQSYQYQDKKRIRVEEKKRIGYHAVEFLVDGDMIFVDGGSTVLYLMNYLKEVRRITIVTPSIAFLMKYVMDGYDRIFKAQEHELIFLGGHINNQILTTYGAQFDFAMEDYHFDKMFFSVDALDIKGGITNSDEVAYEIAKKAGRRSYKKILMTDGTKFGRIANHCVMSWDSLDFLITEKALNQEWQEHLERHHIEWIQA